MSSIRRLLPASAGDRWRWAAVAVLVLFATLVPPLSGLAEQLAPDSVSAQFTIILASEGLVLGLWAISYNLMLGYTGMVSFAHAAYYGIGTYTVALVFHTLHWNMLVGLALTPLSGAIGGLITGFIALRAVRLYFSLLTLAISQLLYVIVFQWDAFTGGDNGVQGLVPPAFLSDVTPQYYFIGGVVALCLVIMFVVVRSPFGAALATIRENRERARSVGINVKAYELAVFTLASVFASVAGGLFAIYNQAAFPLEFFWTANAQPVVVTLLGGMGSFMGPAIGAFIYVFLDNSLSKHFSNEFDILLGGIVLAIVLVAPGGFASFPALFGRIRRRFRAGDQESAGDLESSGQAIRLIDIGKAIASEAIQAGPITRGETLLKVEGLSKSFGGLRAVEGVSFAVAQGDRHAIIGPNGAGKSTLFNLISGRLKPDSGTVFFDGRDITGRPAHAISRSGIGRAFQITSIFPKLTVRQNLQYAMLAHRGLTVRPFGRADSHFREEALALLESVGLGPYADLPAGQLSHGDQRAIELAISLALGNKLLLLDEPTAGMSPFETHKAMELVRRLATERGLTLLFCEHDMEVVFGTARTVTVMHQGRVLTEGTPEQVRANPEVQKVYLGELEVEETA